jgi:hypothetical protein
MDQGAKGLSEDWLSVWIGLSVFVLALGLLTGADMLGWVVTTGVWTDVSKALNPVSKAYSGMGGVGALVATYVALLVVMTAGAAALKADLKRFALGFTAVFWIAISPGSWAAMRISPSPRPPICRDSGSAGRLGSPTKGVSSSPSPPGSSSAISSRVSPHG